MEEVVGRPLDILYTCRGGCGDECGGEHDVGGSKASFTSIDHEY
jgi:hypothetical protein